jgi:hypothetical protein
VVVFQRFVGYGWFRGTVTAATRAGFFQVDFEDGDSRELSEVQVRRWMPQQAHEVGAYVEAQWPTSEVGFTPNWSTESLSSEDRQWYGATVTKVEHVGSAALYSLRYDDGGKASGVGAAHVSPYVALDDETPESVASALSLSLPELLANNRKRYTGLTAASRLRPGTLLVLQPDPPADSKSDEDAAGAPEAPPAKKQKSAAAKTTPRRKPPAPRADLPRKVPEQQAATTRAARSSGSSRNSSSSKASSSKASSSHSSKNKGPAPYHPDVADDFWRYLYRRMCVRAQMYPDTLTLLPGETTPKTFAEVSAAAATHSHAATCSTTWDTITFIFYPGRCQTEDFLAILMRRACV